MTTVEAFAVTFQNLKPEAKAVWLDDMCASDHSRDFLGIIAKQMKGTPVGDWLRGAWKMRAEARS
jgi:hypothetical protein